MVALYQNVQRIYQAPEERAGKMPDVIAQREFPDRLTQIAQCASSLCFNPISDSGDFLFVRSSL